MVTVMSKWHFMPEWAENEIESLGSQSAIPLKKHRGGASLKDLGKKWFAFSKMDVSAIEMLQRVKI